MRSTIITIAMVLALIALPQYAAAQDGTGNGAACSFATVKGTAHDVNDNAAIVGTFSDASGTHGYLLRNGTYTTINDPNAVGLTSAEGINNYGRIVGWYTDSQGIVRAFTLTSGGFRDITIGGSKDTRAFDTNNNGDIVGTYTDPHGLQFSFVRHSNGLVSTVQFPGAVATFARGINDLGWVVGSYQDSNGTQNGFLFQNGTYKKLPLPAAFRVNNSGDIVGNSEVYDHGRITNITSSKYTQIFIFGVNKYDSLVGSGIGPDGHSSSGFFAHCPNVF
jgi:probable HAF family extracellular repeat protein